MHNYVPIEMAISKFQNFDFEFPKFWKILFIFSIAYNFFDFQDSKKLSRPVRDIMPIYRQTKFQVDILIFDIVISHILLKFGPKMPPKMAFRL